MDEDERAASSLRDEVSAEHGLANTGRADEYAGVVREEGTGRLRLDRGQLAVEVHLERGAILAGIKRGRLWVAESAAVDLSFTASAAGRTVGIGERLAVGDAEAVTLTLNVTGAPGAVVRLFTDEGQTFQTTLAAAGSSTVTWTTKPRVSRYVRAEVRRLQDNPALPTTMVAFTNPIFLGQ